jgi:hypothetical protein
VAPADNVKKCEKKKRKRGGKKTEKKTEKKTINKKEACKAATVRKLTSSQLHFKKLK